MNLKNTDSLPTWSSWLESNARKRSVKAALLGTGPELVGSAATCPSTNLLAMKSAEKTGKVKKLPDSTWEKFKEGKSSSPDYTIDGWIEKIKKVGDEVEKDIDKAKNDEKEIEKNKEKFGKQDDKSKLKEKNTGLDKKDKEDKPKFEKQKDNFKSKEKTQESDEKNKKKTGKDKEELFSKEKEDSEKEGDNKNLLPDNKKEPKLWLKFKDKQKEKPSFGQSVKSVKQSGEHP